MLLIIFTLVINFVVAFGVFGDADISTPVATEGSEEDVFYKISGFEGGMGQVWFIVTAVGGILSVAAAILMRSTTPIGIYLFSEIFWTSYTKFIDTVNINNTFGAEPLSMLFLVITVGLMFIWIGALIGMLTGSG
jgi:hypothetical protein